MMSLSALLSSTAVPTGVSTRAGAGETGFPDLATLFAAARQSVAGPGTTLPIISTHPVPPAVASASGATVDPASPAVATRPPDRRDPAWSAASGLEPATLPTIAAAALPALQTDGAADPPSAAVSQGTIAGPRATPATARSPVPDKKITAEARPAAIARAPATGPSAASAASIVAAPAGARASRSTQVADRSTKDAAPDRHDDDQPAAQAMVDLISPSASPPLNAIAPPATAPVVAGLPIPVAGAPRTATVRVVAGFASAFDAQTIPASIALPVAAGGPARADPADPAPVAVVRQAPTTTPDQSAIPVRA